MMITLHICPCQLFFHLNVINWVMLTFPKYRKEMKSIDWGKLYNTYGSNLYDTNELEKRIADLMLDDDEKVFMNLP